ncbi:hypothetical protein IEQ34_015554 [Dendrobium chrysotoxum]|uniref:EF-hand domain-containing protein n=1 Tax=Dendrobium chrysotoxum TaxID=161865 RepID=A0AAV7GJ55_DENCH|nr:hypothetical protein IEQ34_015554 [Dendrobium chrysotoxum]
MGLNRGTRIDKVKKIFDRFDVNRDGGLNREEMSALVVAVNPRVKFTDDQLNAILDEVFRTYADFISPSSGLSLQGLLSTYDDGAGDVNRDFSTLSLQLSSADTSHNAGIVFDSTWSLIDDLDLLIKRLCSKHSQKNKFEILSNAGWSGAFGIRNSSLLWEENTYQDAAFDKELMALRRRADAARSLDEAFEGHNALGRALYDYGFFHEAFVSFRRACKLQPANVISRFRAGNALYTLGHHAEAKEEFLLALDQATKNSHNCAQLLPQIHVNLGISLEAEGMLLGACEHYREAAILCPSHFRALKLLGSALLGVGEVKAAVKALEEAVFLNPHYADAYCDLGSALHAMGGEDERAIQEFQKAIDLNPNHADALYNLGGLLMDMGLFPRALEMYSRVLAEQPSHWRAQLNKAVAFLGEGEVDEAKKAMNEAFSMTNRIEVYDALADLKKLQKMNKKKKYGAADDEDFAFLAEGPVNFIRDGEKTSVKQDLANALEIQAFQNLTRLGHCDVEVLSKELIETHAAISPSAGTIRKAAVEMVLRRMLHFLKAEAFIAALKSINERVLSVMEASSFSTKVDLGMLLAVLAPICSGSARRRKQAAFDALLWRPINRGGNQIWRSDATAYLKLLRTVFIPSEVVSGLMETQDLPADSKISFIEFIDLFDDKNRGFGILGTLLKLEASDQVRHGARACSICNFPIIGSRLKQKKRSFSLCKNCCRQGKVPLSYRHEDYQTLKVDCMCFSVHFSSFQSDNK